MQDASPSAEPSRRSYILLGERVLIPATLKNSTTGYKNVNYDRGNNKFKAQVRVAGKSVSLGYFDTAEEAAIAYARSEYGRADAAKLLQPRAAPTAAGAEAIRQAAREGLTLTASSNSTGYKGVCYRPKERGSKKYKLKVKVGRKDVHLGYFATAEQAALFYARWEAGRDTSDLIAPPPPPPPPPPPAPSSAAGAEAARQAKREGLTLATSSSSSSGYRNVIFKPKERGKKYELRVGFGGKQNFLGLFATAEEAALARARHLWDTTVRLLEPQPQQAPPQGAAGPSEASSYEEAEDGFDPADIAAAVSLAALRPAAFRERAEGGEAAGSRSGAGGGGVG